MAGCGGCGKKSRRPPPVNKRRPYDVMGGYKYLQPHQIRARLEAYKRIHCKNCERKFECDFEMYEQCQKYRIDK
jgi:hypothetical protein